VGYGLFFVKSVKRLDKSSVKEMRRVFNFKQTQVRIFSFNSGFISYRKIRFFLYEKKCTRGYLYEDSQA